MSIKRSGIRGVIVVVAALFSIFLSAGNVKLVGNAETVEFGEVAQSNLIVAAEAHQVVGGWSWRKFGEGALCGAAIGATAMMFLSGPVGMAVFVTNFGAFGAAVSVAGMCLSAIP